jgi:PEP-CTERM motif
MKKSSTLLLAFCGLTAFLIIPGIAVANGPISPTGFVPRADNTYYLPNTGGGAGPEWGPYVGVDSHGDASPYMRDPNGWTPGPLYGGLVLTWAGNSSTLPTGLSFNQPFDFAAPAQYTSLTPPSGVPTTLQALLTQYGSRINDMVWFDGGISTANVISEPIRSLLPFATSSDVLQNGLWNGVSLMYANYPVVVIPEMAGVYTPYTAQGITWPGWDPTVPDWQWYTQPGYWNPDYPAPSTWREYTFYIQNDCPTVPEPGVLLLFGSGLIALIPMRRMIRK